MLCILSDII